MTTASASMPAALLTTDHDIETVATLEMRSLVDEWERTLTLKAQAAKRRLMAKTVLVRGFKQSRAEMPMHLDTGPNHSLRTITISPLLRSSPLPTFLLHLSHPIGHRARSVAR